MQYARLRALTRTLPFLLTVPGLAFGQPVQTPTRAEAMAALNPAPAALRPAQLDQMLAPIALYPDQLLLEVLMASTFPQQVIDAGKWLQDGNNAALSGDQLVAALQPLPWDPSVKALVAFPQIITMMNDHLDWTEALGTAFANQQVAVMARVQFLRQRAVTAGRLASTPHLRIENQEGEIIIEPEDPAMIYVPVYNPAEAYGQWPDSADPPIYLPPPPGFVEGAIGAGIGFSIGYGIAAPLWGWGHPDWRRHQVIIDPDRYGRITDPANIGRNQATVDHQVWHRTAPVVRVPDAQRPAPANASAPHPPGTVSSTAVALPRPPPAAPPPPTGAAQPPVALPHPSGAAPPAAPPHPAEVVHPPGVPPQSAPPHPAEVVHPPGTPPAVPPHPAEVVHQPGTPPAVPPHPAEVGHPPAAPPHLAAPPPQAAPPHPPAPPPQAAPLHPAAPPPQAAPPRPAAPPPQAAPPHPAAPPPQAAPPRPAAPPPQAAPPRPAAPPPQAAPPHPAGLPPQAAPPHPAGPPAQAAPPHPAAPPPQAAPHPAAPPPAKNPPPKPGEEEKH